MALTLALPVSGCALAEPRPLFWVVHVAERRGARPLVSPLQGQGRRPLRPGAWRGCAQADFSGRCSTAGACLSNAPRSRIAPAAPSGTGLAGLACSRCGAVEVVLSDSGSLPDVLENLRQTAAAAAAAAAEQGAAACPVRVAAVSWGQFSPDVLALDPPDLILAADCLYDSKGACRRLQEQGESADDFRGSRDLLHIKMTMG